MDIRPLSSKNLPEWIRLRHQLWPQEKESTSKEEINRILNTDSMICFGLFENEELRGKVELSLRNIVDGCLSSPVVYLEAWIIDEKHRGKGYGKALVEKAKEWGRSKGCTEMGSDTEIARTDSIKTHKALGFEEVDRVVNFRLDL